MTRYKILSALIVTSFMSIQDQVRAQPVDFSIQDLVVCDISATEFEFSYAIGVENRSLTASSPMDVPFRITVTGPDSAVDDNQVANLEWPLDKHGTCGTTAQGACNAACPAWTLRVVKGANTKLFSYTPECVNVGDPTCKCAGKAVAPPKKKPKQDGPSGPYFVTITIDPDNTIAELDESNNTMTVQLQNGQNVGQCPAVPAASTWGIAALTLLMLCAATIVMKKRAVTT